MCGGDVHGGGDTWEMRERDMKVGRKGGKEPCEGVYNERIN